MKNKKLKYGFIKFYKDKILNIVDYEKWRKVFYHSVWSFNIQISNGFLHVQIVSNVNVRMRRTHIFTSFGIVKPFQWRIANLEFKNYITHFGALSWHCLKDETCTIYAE